MTVSDFLNEGRVTGTLLILAFISFAVGASIPLLGEKGNAGIYTLPVRDYLQAVAKNANAWRWGNIFMAAAIVILVAGLTLLTTMLEGANERSLSRLGFAGILMAAVLWVIFSIFRAVVTTAAAQEMAATGTAPSYYEPLGKWGFALFYTYAVLGYLALAAYGGSLLQVGLVPAWAGWSTLVFSIAMLILLLITGDSLPAFHYFPGLLIGFLLIMGG